MPDQGFGTATAVFKNLSNDEQRMSLYHLKRLERTVLFSGSHFFKAKQFLYPTSRSLTGSKLCSRGCVCVWNVPYSWPYSAYRGRKQRKKLPFQVTIFHLKIRPKFALGFRPHTWGKLCIHTLMKGQKGICSEEENAWIVRQDFYIADFLFPIRASTKHYQPQAKNQMKPCSTNLRILWFNKKCSVALFSKPFARLCKHVPNFSHSNEATWSHS